MWVWALNLSIPKEQPVLSITEPSLQPRYSEFYVGKKYMSVSKRVLRRQGMKG